MKVKHVLFALLTAVIIGVCIVSPFVVSVIDNNRLLSKPIAETTEAVDTTAFDTEQRQLTHGEKIQLYIDYSAQNSSVTRSANRKNNTLMTTQEAEIKGKEEFLNLLSGHLHDSPLEQSSQVIKSMYLISAETVTYVDQEDLSRHAIFWVLQYELPAKDDVMFVSIMMDDETGKIYQFGAGLSKGMTGEPTSTIETLIAVTYGFADYLDMTVEWPKDFYSEYRNPFGGTAYMLIRDNETGLNIPYEVGIWAENNLTFTLPAEGNGIADIVSYQAKTGAIEEDKIG